MDEVYIEHMLAELGEPVVACRVARDWADTSQAHQGYALVQLRSPRAASHVVADVGARGLPALFPRRFHVRPGTRPCSVWVGGLDVPWASEAFLAFLFADEQISQIHVPLDEATKKPRGFGFVTLTTEEAARRVVSSYKGAPMGRGLIHPVELSSFDLAMPQLRTGAMPNGAAMPQLSNRNGMDNGLGSGVGNGMSAAGLGGAGLGLPMPMMPLGMPMPMMMPQLAAQPQLQPQPQSQPLSLSLSLSQPLARQHGAPPDANGDADAPASDAAAAPAAASSSRAWPDPTAARGGAASGVVAADSLDEERGLLAAAREVHALAQTNAFDAATRLQLAVRARNLLQLAIRRLDGHAEPEGELALELVPSPSATGRAVAADE